MRKAKSQKIHAMRRAWDRYGLVLTNDDYFKICLKIRRKESRFIERQSIRVTVHEVEYKGKLIKVVYDSKRKRIVTFLPLEGLRREGQLLRIRGKKVIVYTDREGKRYAY